MAEEKGGKIKDALSPAQYIKISNNKKQKRRRKDERKNHEINFMNQDVPALSFEVL